jgi:hypothetical protein
MRLATALFFAIIIAASSTSAEASVVSAEATADWTSFTFTTTGNLSATMIVQASQEASTSTTTTPTTPEGSATAAASAVNGFLTTSAGAVATGPGFANVGRGFVFASSVFWFYGTGTGSLVVTVPYHLELNSVETSDRDITSASASVNLFTGPGVGGSTDASDALSLTGAGAMSHDGMLTATSRLLVNPTFGPLVDLGLFTEVRASAAVPETTSTLVLLTLGLLVIGARWRC